MAKSRYFCIATQTVIETDGENRLISVPVTKVLLYQDMNVGVKSVMYSLWQASQEGGVTDKDIHVDAENNSFCMLQKTPGGGMKMTSWLTVPCRGVKWNDTFEPVDDIQNDGIDFVSNMYATYINSRMKFVTALVSAGHTDAELHAAGVTTDEVEKVKHRSKSA